MSSQKNIGSSFNEIVTRLIAITNNSTNTTKQCIEYYQLYLEQINISYKSSILLEYLLPSLASTQADITALIIALDLLAKNGTATNDGTATNQSDWQHRNMVLMQHIVSSTNAINGKKEKFSPAEEKTLDLLLKTVNGKAVCATFRSIAQSNAKYHTANDEKKWATVDIMLATIFPPTAKSTVIIEEVQSMADEKPTANNLERKSS